MEIHPSLAPLAGAINGMDDKVNSVIKESANFASNLITGGVADYKAEPSKFGNISDVAMDKLNKVKASISTWWDNGTARSDLPTNVTAVAKAESVTQPIPDKTIPVNNSFGGRVDLSQLEKPLPTPKVSVVKYLGL